MTTPTIETLAPVGALVVTSTGDGPSGRRLQAGVEVLEQVGEVGVVITGPGPSLLIDGSTIPTPHPEVFVEDRTVAVVHYGATIAAGCGAVLIAGDDVTCEAEIGATVYLTAHAHLQGVPAGALERGDLTVVTIDSLRHGALMAGLAAHAPTPAVGVPVDTLRG